MRLFTISACLLTLLVACSKKDVTPASNTNATTALKADSVTQLPVTGTFIPFTDTFYGMVYESWTTPTAADSVQEIHIYASYPSQREVKFSSDNYSSRQGFGIRFNGDFIMCDSNFYTTASGSNPNFYNFRLRKDSIFYNLSAESCSDMDRIYFAGKKANKRVVRQR